MDLPEGSIYYMSDPQEGLGACLRLLIPISKFQGGDSFSALESTKEGQPYGTAAHFFFEIMRVVNGIPNGANRASLLLTRLPTHDHVETAGDDDEEMPALENDNIVTAAMLSPKRGTEAVILWLVIDGDGASGALELAMDLYFDDVKQAKKREKQDASDFKKAEGGRPKIWRPADSLRSTDSFRAMLETLFRGTPEGAMLRERECRLRTGEAALMRELMSPFRELRCPHIHRGFLVPEMFAEYGTTHQVSFTSRTALVTTKLNVINLYQFQRSLLPLQPVIGQEVLEDTPGIIQTFFPPEDATTYVTLDRHEFTLRLRSCLSSVETMEAIMMSYKGGIARSTPELQAWFRQKWATFNEESDECIRRGYQSTEQGYGSGDARQDLNTHLSHNLQRLQTFFRNLVGPAMDAYLTPGGEHMSVPLTSAVELLRGPAGSERGKPYWLSAGFGSFCDLEVGAGLQASMHLLLEDALHCGMNADAAKLLFDSACSATLRGMHLHVVLHGPPGTGKSWLLKMVTEYLLVGDTTTMTQSMSPKAMTASGTMDGTVIAEEEMNRVSFRLEPGGSNAAVLEYRKTLLTSDVMTNLYLRMHNDGSRSQVTSHCRTSIAFWGCTNFDFPREATPAMQSRTCAIYVADYSRHGHGANDNPIKTPADCDRLRRVAYPFRHMHALCLLLHEATHVGAMPSFPLPMFDTAMRDITDKYNRAVGACRLGKEKDTRYQGRMRCSTMLYSIQRALFLVFQSPASPLRGKWDASAGRYRSAPGGFANFVYLLPHLYDSTPEASFYGIMGPGCIDQNLTSKGAILRALMVLCARRSFPVVQQTLSSANLRRRTDRYNNSSDYDPDAGSRWSYQPGHPNGADGGGGGGGLVADTTAAVTTHVDSNLPGQNPVAARPDRTDWDESRVPWSLRAPSKRDGPGFLPGYDSRVYAGDVSLHWSPEKAPFVQQHQLKQEILTDRLFDPTVGEGDHTEFKEKAKVALDEAHQMWHRRCRARLATGVGRAKRLDGRLYLQLPGLGPDPGVNSDAALRNLRDRLAHDLLSCCDRSILDTPGRIRTMYEELLQKPNSLIREHKDGLLVDIDLAYNADPLQQVISMLLDCFSRQITMPHTMVTGCHQRPSFLPAKLCVLPSPFGLTPPPPERVSKTSVPGFGGEQEEDWKACLEGHGRIEASDPAWKAMAQDFVGASAMERSRLAHCRKLRLPFYQPPAPSSGQAFGVSLEKPIQQTWVMGTVPEVNRLHQLAVIENLQQCRSWKQHMATGGSPSKAQTVAKRALVEYAPIERLYYNLNQLREHGRYSLLPVPKFRRPDKLPSPDPVPDRVALRVVQEAEAEAEAGAEETKSADLTEQRRRHPFLTSPSNDSQGSTGSLTTSLRRTNLQGSAGASPRPAKRIRTGRPFRPVDVRVPGDPSDSSGPRTPSPSEEWEARPYVWGDEDDAEDHDVTMTGHGSTWKPRQGSNGGTGTVDGKQYAPDTQMATGWPHR